MNSLEPMNRRDILGTIAGVGTAIAGCLGRDSSPTRSEEPAATSSATRAETPNDRCQHSVERVTHVHNIKEGPLGGFELTANRERAPFGSHLVFELTNVADERRMTGDGTNYIVERKTANEWESIFWHQTPGTVFWNDMGVYHEPGEGFTWDLEMTPKGLEDRFYRVCEPLGPGEYRFVYWGIISNSEKERDNEDALAVAFTIT